eukprot:561895-Pyramimonas_sp.AAC.1
MAPFRNLETAVNSESASQCRRERRKMADSIFEQMYNLNGAVSRQTDTFDSKIKEISATTG